MTDPIGGQPRILFLGENWYGSCARACAYALRRAGCDVRDLDIQRFLPTYRGTLLRVAMRCLRRGSVREYNDRVLESARAVRPDILIAFKAGQLEAATLRQLRQQGIRLYNYFPDLSAFAHGPWLLEALPEYDIVFYTKPSWEKDTRRRLHLRQAILLPHGYDADIHRPLPLLERDRNDYGVEVSFVGTYSPDKEKKLAALLAARALNMRIWGLGWAERCIDPRVRKAVVGVSAEGDTYARVLQASDINLGLLSDYAPGASAGDLTTTRTYEIPACGGFMLHQRNNEVLELFREGEEIACFGSDDEMVAKVDYYLAHPDERGRLAEAAHRRCVPAYSYDERMRVLLSHHRESVNSGAVR